MARTAASFAQPLSLPPVNGRDSRVVFWFDD
jgi:hypothetical protein